VRYHQLKPQYLARRLADVARASNEWRLRVLLCQVDAEDHAAAMLELNVLAVRHECTLVLAHSAREAARLIECFKAYENNGGAAIKEKVDKDHLSRLTDVLTTVKPLNKTDVVTLARTFGSLKGVVEASLEDLRDCPGLGDAKVANLHDVFTQPFSHAARRRRAEQQQRTTVVVQAEAEDEDEDAAGGGAGASTAASAQTSSSSSSMAANGGGGTKRARPQETSSEADA